MAIPDVERKTLTNSSETLNDVPFLRFTNDEIDKAWKELPYRPDLYKLEVDFRLEVREGEGLTNFHNLGGNYATRPKFFLDEERVFVEANWITDQIIATGYPTVGTMRNHY